MRAMRSSRGSRPKISSFSSIEPEAAPGPPLKTNVRGRLSSLSFARYEKEFLQDGFRNLLHRQIKKGKLTEQQAAGLTDEYESHYHGYTYLASNGHR